LARPNPGSLTLGDENLDVAFPNRFLPHCFVSRYLPGLLLFPFPFFPLSFFSRLPFLPPLPSFFFLVFVSRRERLKTFRFPHVRSPIGNCGRPRGGPALQYATAVFWPGWLACSAEGLFRHFPFPVVSGPRLLVDPNCRST